MSDDQPGMRDAAKVGLRRAAFHLLKAAWEVLSGVEAFLDEMAKVRHAPADDEAARQDQGPTRIVVE